jgi:hypothetical protein
MPRLIVGTIERPASRKLRQPDLLRRIEDHAPSASHLEPLTHDRADRWSLRAIGQRGFDEVEQWMQKYQSGPAWP